MTSRQTELVSEKRSAWALYRELVVGDSSLPFFIAYECVHGLFTSLPGIVGYGLRSCVYPYLFAGCGKRPAIGKHVMIRNPKKIVLEDKVMLDDGVSLDARGSNASIRIGSYSSIGRQSIIVAKDAEIVLGNAVNIGSTCRIATQSKLEIGDSTLIAAYAYIGPGNHQFGDEETPLIAQEMDLKGGVKIGANVWVGTRATILDGVEIGDKAIIGAHSLVKENVPAGAIVAGSPAKIIGKVK